MARIDQDNRERLRRWAEQVMRSYFGEDLGSHPLSSTFGQCLLELGAAAQLVNGDENRDEDLHYIPVYAQIERFAWDLAMVVARSPDHRPLPNFWRHLHQPVWDVRQGDPVVINRLELEATVDGYLELPVRTRFVDRLLLDMLVACEYVAYAKVVYGKVSKYEPPLYQSATIGNFAKGRAKSLVFFIVAYIVAALLPWDSLPTAVFWIGVAETIISISILPFAHRHLTRRNELVLAPLRSIGLVYADLDSTGSISARHVWEQATKATDNRVGWPGPLFVLLDDVLARSGRL